MLRSIIAGTIFMGGVMFYVLPHGNTLLMCINMGLLGLFLLPMLSIGFSYTAEVSYPVNEPLSTGIMMLFSQLFGTITSYLGKLAGIHPENNKD